MSIEWILKRMVKGFFPWQYRGSGINYHTRSGFHHQRQRILLSRLCLIDISFFLSFSDLQLGTSANLINSDASSLIKNYLLPITVPFLCQKSNSCLLNKSDSGKAVYYRNPNFHVILPENHESRIQELLLPFYRSNISMIIGDHLSHELTIGDDIRAPTALHCKRILKIRRKKMKKHKYRKRRKLNLYKRRSLKILREKRKKKEKREEERKIEWEKVHSDWQCTLDIVNKEKVWIKN